MIYDFVQKQVVEHLTNKVDEDQQPPKSSDRMGGCTSDGQQVSPLWEEVRLLQVVDATHASL